MLELNNLSGFGGVGATGATPSATGMFVWGDNSSGQAGGGGSTADPVQVPTETDTTDDIVINSKSFSMASHAGFIIGNQLYTAGLNTYGQLAQGDLDNLNAFTSVSTNGAASDFALGQRHTLTVRDGEVNGCGSNNHNQLVAGTGSPTTLSVIVQAAAMGDADAIKVYASRYSSAVLTSKNEVYVWGQSVVTSGSSNIDDPLNMLSRFPDDFAGSDKSQEPEYIDVGLGDTHIILLTDEGSVFTQSNSNPYGQQGNGTTSRSSEVLDQFNQGATKVAAGRYTSYVIAGGILYAAGRGDSGEMGAATSDQINSTFIDIGGGITDWVDVQAGSAYVIAQRQDGTLYHSGSNIYYQQGNNAAGSDQFGFVQIIGTTTAKVYGAYVAARRTIYGLVLD